MLTYIYQAKENPETSRCVVLVTHNDIVIHSNDHYFVNLDLIVAKLIVEKSVFEHIEWDLLIVDAAQNITYDTDPVKWTIVGG